VPPRARHAHRLGKVPGMDLDAPAQERLRSDVIAWLTTVSPEGQPQSSPVWFLWEGGSFLIFSRPDKPKLRNIAANPRVSVHLRGSEEGGEIATFEGTAEVLPDAPPADEVAEYVEKYRDHMRGGGWTPASFASDYSQPIRIRPTAARTW
jgi:PPOX class probable F420-dependent enzyme